MWEQIKIFIVAWISFVAIDFVWLTKIAKPFYIRHFSAIGRIENGEWRVVTWAVLAVYVMMSLGVTYFVMPRVLPEQNKFMVFVSGAVFGAVAYGIYDFTNLATLKDWGVTLSLVDMAWGTFLCGAVTVVAHFVALKTR